MRFLERRVRSKASLVREADGELSQMIKSLIEATKAANKALVPLNDPISETIAGALGEAFKKSGGDGSGILDRLFGGGGEGTSDPGVIKPLANTYKAVIIAIDGAVDRISALASENQEEFKSVASQGGTLVDALKASVEAQKSAGDAEELGGELSQDELKTIEDNAQKVATEIHGVIKGALDSIGSGIGNDLDPADVLEVPLTSYNALNDIVDNMDAVDVDKIIEVLNTQTPDQGEVNQDNKDSGSDTNDESIKKAARKVALLWQASERNQSKFIKQLMAAGLNLEKLSSITLE